MRIVVTGGSGAIGRSAVPRLIAAGHQVVGLHHSEAGGRWLADAGADPRRVDLFDPSAVQRALDGAETVVHLATSMPPLDKANSARRWRTNDRLRRVATRNLVEAAVDADAGRVIVGSSTSNYADLGHLWITEGDPVCPVFRPTVSALDMEAVVAEFARRGGVGVSLRFANLYGPGRASRELVDALHAREVPLVGPGVNFVSSIHVDDAGAAVAAALGARSGCFNVADDLPIRAKERLEILRAGVEAPPVRHMSISVARRSFGRASHQFTVSHRILNRRFRATTGWAPIHATLRDGWPTVAEPGASAVRDASTALVAASGAAMIDPRGVWRKRARP